MKLTKTELKKLLKPLVKECIQESLLEEGLLSNVISEVVRGLGSTQQMIVENKQDNEDEIEQLQLEEKQKRVQKINETKKQMLDAIGNSAYNGVNLFEGTTPMKAANNSPAAMADPLSGQEPEDPGVDISKLMGNSNVWKKLAGN